MAAILEFLPLPSAEQCPQDWEIIVPDDDLDRAYHVLLERGFLACPVGKGCPYHLETERTERERKVAYRPPSKHLHLHNNDPRTILLHKKSEILWTVSTFEPFSAKEHAEAKIILASDQNVLPARTLSGEGAFDTGYPALRIPSAHCLVEAMIRLAVRDYDESDDTLLIQTRWMDNIDTFMHHSGEERLQYQYMEPQCSHFLKETGMYLNVYPQFCALKRSLAESN